MIILWHKLSKTIVYPTPPTDFIDLSLWTSQGKIAPTTGRVNRLHSLTETGKRTPKDTGGRPKVVSGLGTRWAKGRRWLKNEVMKPLAPTGMPFHLPPVVCPLNFDIMEIVLSRRKEI